MAKIDKKNLTLEANGWVVRWVDLNEGNSGDYNENDPNDTPFLRFDVFIKGEKGELVDPDFDSSFCTRMPRHTPVNTLVSGLLKILTELVNEDGKEEGKRNYKGLMQRMSWMDPQWF